MHALFAIQIESTVKETSLVECQPPSLLLVAHSDQVMIDSILWSVCSNHFYTCSLYVIIICMYVVCM